MNDTIDFLSFSAKIMVIVIIVPPIFLILIGIGLIGNLVGSLATVGWTYDLVDDIVWYCKLQLNR